MYVAVTMLSSSTVDRVCGYRLESTVKLIAVAPAMLYAADYRDVEEHPHPANQERCSIRRMPSRGSRATTQATATCWFGTSGMHCGRRLPSVLVSSNTLTCGRPVIGQARKCRAELRGIDESDIPTSIRQLLTRTR